MKKMGWREGEGLGKNKEGSKEPILVDFKTDRKGEPFLFEFDCCVPIVLIQHSSSKYISRFLYEVHLSAIILSSSE